MHAQSEQQNRRQALTAAEEDVSEGKGHQNPEVGLSESAATYTLQKPGQAAVPAQASASSFMECRKLLGPCFSVRLSMPPGIQGRAVRGSSGFIRLPGKDPFEEKQNKTK